MDKKRLEEVVLEQKEIPQGIELGIEREKLKEISQYESMPHALIISGIRRVGKSTLLAQLIHHDYKDKVYYLSFEDERLLDFSVEDFNSLFEIFLELYGEKKVFVFDEIQNVPHWETFVRRLQDKKYRFFITGSNASLLSKELGSKLTGRCLVLELYPFSFREFLYFKGHSLKEKDLLLTSERAKIKKLFKEYLREGGMPEYLKYKDPIVLKRVYEDILYRDIVARHEIKEVKILRELSLYLLSNITSLASFNKLKQLLQLGSVNTVKSYIQFLEDSYLFFTVNRYSHSLKQQYIAPKKIYCIDNGFIDAIAFQFSKNEGKFLENLVFIELKRRGKNIFYYKTANDLEIDFLIQEEKNKIRLIQVSTTLAQKNTKERETQALLKAMEELSLKEALLLTYDEEDLIETAGKKITIKPVYKWLLEN